ncbi:uridine-cytidine kinase-like 1 isoform X4 [Pseudoliparis swirei]|uniref:uridine-cytidine kinase-like 1 isoform X4 n=1 Tax=Pseudoliparis swirei TaxID=2059687 RepID=UPI0024BE7627|nr:uridine-cytidine kinase-like 1 isoform X4 [Pseudoliparis swirei]
MTLSVFGFPRRADQTEPDMEPASGSGAVKAAGQPADGEGAEADRSVSRSDSWSGDDSLDGVPRCPLTPSLSPRQRTASRSKTEPPLLRTNKRTIYTAGRPPWYNVTGTTFKEAFVIAGPHFADQQGKILASVPAAVKLRLCGGSACGKTTVANKIIEALDVPWVVLLSMDSFYKVLSEEEEELAANNEYNFDHPDAFDFELLVAVLRKLKKGKSVKVPVYDFTSHCRRKEWKTVYGANVVIFEGILAFANKELLKLLDMKVFVDTDSDIRLVRRLRRDISQRGRNIDGIIKQYNKFVKPAFEQYIEPTVQAADIVVPRGGENFVALDLIVQHVHSQLEKIGSGLSSSGSAVTQNPQPDGVHPTGARHAHHHQEQRDEQRRVHLLLQEVDAPPHRARALLPAAQPGIRGDASGRSLRRQEAERQTNHRRVHPEGRRDDGAGSDGRVQRHPPRKDPDPDQPQHRGAGAPLPPPAQRHQRGLRGPDGQHRVHRRRRSHGRQSSAGPRRGGGQDLPDVAADGGAGRPLGGLRLPQGPHHHHGRGQGGQRPVPHHPGHR